MLTRRRFLKESALAAGALALARLDLRSADAAGAPMLGCDTYSLRQLFTKGELNALTAPAFYRDLEIPGISYNDWYLKSLEDAYLDSVKQAVRDAGRTMNCLVCSGNLATPDEAARRRQVETNARKLRAAARLGATTVRFDLGKVGPEEDNATVGVERVTAAFQELVPLARELNIKMTIENHGGVSGSADNILRIIRGSDPKWVGSCLDFGNWPAAARYESCEALAPYAYHVHAKAYNFGPDGEETRIDYGRVLAMLQKVKYTGAISIEFEGGGDPVEGVKKTRDLVRRHWPGI